MKTGFIALAGRPNAGKSTLLNALFQRKLAIVSSKAQTTRTQIRGILTEPDEYQIIFTDTPGIHKPHHLLESRMNKEAGGAIQGTDLIYLVVDASVPYAQGDAFVLNMVKQAGVPVFLILNKTDKMKKEQVVKCLERWQSRFSFAEYFALSAMKQKDFKDLLKTSAKYLPEGELMYPANEISDEPENFYIAEIIREKVLQCTEEEVPHATAVLVERKQKNKDVFYIQAVILVERDGQKGILIGKQGSMLNKIGSRARLELQEYLGGKVYLELFVRVEPEWRDRAGRISEYGYGLTDE